MLGNATRLSSAQPAVNQFRLQPPIRMTITELYSILENTPGAVHEIFELRRLRLSQSIAANLNYTVAHGPFRGLKLNPESHWNLADQASMLLGLYESEVLDKIAALSSTFRHFVDIGASDGYYCIGALTSGLFESSTGYEISEKGRAVMTSNAFLNSVNPTIKAEAKPDFYLDFSSTDPKRHLFLIDVEGMEFTILSRQTFAHLQHSAFIIEIHDWAGNFEDAFVQLLKAAQGTHSCEMLLPGGRNPNAFDHLRNLNDQDRWILCAEGRPKRMSWLCCTPKQSRPTMH
jgi:hypothetical protein